MRRLVDSGRGCQSIKLLLVFLVVTLFVATNLSASFSILEPLDTYDTTAAAAVESHQYRPARHKTLLLGETRIQRFNTSSKRRIEPSLTTEEGGTLPRSIPKLQSLQNPPPRPEPPLRPTEIQRTLDNSTAFDSNPETCYRDGIPSFIIAGAQKAGTSALYYVLEALWDLQPSLAFEAHFFDARGNLGRNASVLTDEQICQARRNYQSFFPHLPTGQSEVIRTFEKTPVYLCRPFIPEMVHKITPWTKVVVLLRNPVERTYSAYKMMYERSHDEKKYAISLERAIHQNIRLLRQRFISTAPLLEEAQTATTADFALPPDSAAVHERTNYPDVLEELLPRGFYAVQLRNWMQYFELGRNLKVVQYENFDRNRSAVLNDILEFVGATHPHGLPPAVLNEKYHPKRYIPRRKALPMADSTRQYLEHFFAPYNAELADLLGEEWRGVWKTTGTGE